MSYSTVMCACTFAVVGLAAICDTAAAQTDSRSVEQEPAIVAHSTDLSEREATLSFQLTNGESVAISFSRGVVFLNQRRITSYDSGGELELTWRRLLERAPELGPQEMLRSMRAWSAENLGEEADAALTAVLPSLVAPEGLEALGGLEALKNLAALEALEALKGLDVGALQTEIREQLRAVRAAAAESALAEVQISDASDPMKRSLLNQMAGDIAGLVASFVAMCSLGFGLVFFAPRQLEVVAETVRHSFWRSFFAGFFAQPLIIPVFGLLMLGLALTVVGILVIPFAAIAFAAAVVLSVLGGYLAVARAVGEAFLRRRMSLGHAVGGWLAYKYVVYGLVALFAIWLPATVLGWAPAAGQFFTVTAILISWVLATAGFGATILSHAGIRGTFTRRFDQAFSDEYLHRTTHATRAAPSRQDQGRVEL